MVVKIVVMIIVIGFVGFEIRVEEFLNKVVKKLIKMVFYRFVFVFVLEVILNVNVNGSEMMVVVILLNRL